MPNETKLQKTDYSAINGLIILIVYMILVPRVEGWIGKENIEQFITAAGALGPVFFVLLRILTVVISPLRLGPIAILLHRAFGFWNSVIYAIIVQVVGTAINYWIGKRYGKSLIKWMMGEQLSEQIDTYAHKFLNKNFWATTLLMVSINFEIVAYAGGMGKSKFKQFMLSSLLASLIVSPLLVSQHVLIGENNIAVFAIRIGTTLLSFGCIYWMAGDDIKKWWKEEMKKNH